MNLPPESSTEKFSSPDGPHFQFEAAEGIERSGEVAAWTEVDKGRYMPRRVRGSCIGRALG
ncbi:MAG: hypothetical protein RIS70_2591 [Planctomycetota bacterium]|jgi:hypothetical protein